jgi:hypothetical protein
MAVIVHMANKLLYPCLNDCSFLGDHAGNSTPSSFSP